MTALDSGSRLAGASSGSTYPLGMTIVILGVFMIFIVVCILDILCALKRWPSIGYRVQRWSRQNPFYVLLFLAVVGAMLAHFLAHHIT
jgi:hypothetical protein